MDPINYSIDVQSPFQSALQGYQAGAAIRNDQLQQQQQQQAVQAQQAQQQALQRLMANPNPTAKDYSDATLLIPGMKEQFKQAWDMRNNDQQQNDLSHVGQVYAALQSNQPGVASQLLNNRAQALRNSGNEQDAKSAEIMAQVAETSPALAKSMIGLKLSAIPGGDKVITGATTLNQDSRAAELQPGLVTKGAADASTAQSEAAIKAVAASNAPTATVLGNQKTAQEIKASELAGQISQIDAQIKAANSETERGKLTLEREKLVMEQTKLQQGQATNAQDSQNATTNALTTLGQIKAHPGFKAQDYGGPWSKIKGMMPGTERQALQGWVDSLKGQLSYQNLMGMKAASPNGASGLGALSEGEQKMLAGLAGNLDLDSKDFPKQLSQVERFLQKAQNTTVARGQLPTTGEAFVMRHPIYGNVTEGQINALMRQYPGQTRDQIIKFLQATGGK
jgi:hypothetical protein